MLMQMRAVGAIVVSLERSEDRLKLLNAGMRKYGWFATSPFTAHVVGSNPIAIEGYKTIAYEIAEDMDWEVPEWCVLPVCYGDALAALRRGFADMVALGWTKRIPRLVAVEISGSLSAAMRSDRDQLPEIRLNTMTVASSIGATRGTFQALDALRRAHGFAIKADDESIMKWQDALAREEGIWLEPSAAASLVGLAALVSRKEIVPSDNVVILATAGGLKDPARSESHMKSVPIVPPDLDSALEIVRHTYGFDAASVTP
jgi:threonine synthase